MLSPGWVGLVGAAQRHVQDGALLGGIDGLTAEHGPRLIGHARFIGQLQQRVVDGLVDALAAVVERDATGIEAHGGAARGLFEQVAQVRHGACRELLQSLPSGALGGGGEGV